MNLSQLEVLVAIVDTGSLTEAGEVVGLTQSAVSYSLSRLEAELGVTLLQRGRQGVAVTQIGEEVLHHARSVLAQVDIIRQKTARERGLAVGKLRLGCVQSVAARLLTGIVRDFQVRYPDVEVVLFEGTPQELLNWLDTQVIDVATVMSHEAYPITVPLAQNEIKIIVAERHPLAAHHEVSIAALAHETLLVPRAEYDMIARFAGFEGITLPRLRHEVSARSTIFAMVRENMGVSMAPEMLIDALGEGIVAISFVPRLYLNVHLAAAVQSPVLEAFLSSAHTWARGHGFLPDSA